MLPVILWEETNEQLLDDRFPLIKMVIISQSFALLGELETPVNWEKQAMLKHVIIMVVKTSRICFY